jgi:hypothetical protein
VSCDMRSMRSSKWRSCHRLTPRIRCLTSPFLALPSVRNTFCCGCRHLNTVADELSNIAIDTGGWEGVKSPQVRF